MSNPALNFKKRMLAKAAEAAQAKTAAAETTAQAQVAVNTAQAAAPKLTGNAALDFRKRKQSEAARKILAANRDKQATAKQEATTAVQEGFQMLLHQLDQDEKSLRALPRGQARNDMLSNQLLPVWRPEVEKYLDAGENYPNPILVLVMIWCYNVGDIDFALRCAETALAQGQRMPERFTRTLESFVADQTLEWATAQALQKKPYEPQFGTVVDRLPGWISVPDIVRIKFLKFRAHQAESEDPETALALYREAFAIDPIASKTKTVIPKLEKRIAKAAEAAGAAEK